MMRNLIFKFNSIIYLLIFVKDFFELFEILSFFLFPCLFSINDTIRH
jgi:hypothetical protein